MIVCSIIRAISAAIIAIAWASWAGASSPALSRLRIAEWTSTNRESIEASAPDRGVRPDQSSTAIRFPSQTVLRVRWTQKNDGQRWPRSRRIVCDNGSPITGAGRKRCDAPPPEDDSRCRLTRIVVVGYCGAMGLVTFPVRIHPALIALVTAAWRSSALRAQAYPLAGSNSSRSHLSETN